MKRLPLRAALAVALLPLVAAPATACMWDRETVAHEKQFKSNYLEQPGGTPSGGQYPTTFPTVTPLVGGAGLLMLVGGIIVGSVRLSARRRGRPPGNAA